jgi:hypothetical protein
MRSGLAISAIIHAAIVLWVTLAPGSKPFDPAYAEPIMVDLVPAREAEAKPEQANSAPIKPAPTKPALQADQKPAAQADQKPAAASKLEPATANGLAEQADTAARLAWMLDLPSGSFNDLAAPPSGLKSKLSSEEIAEFKAHVRKCFVRPPGVANEPDLQVTIRVALNSDGSLGVPPEMVSAKASMGGPALRDSAIQALQKCQPYGFLPADRYKDWKILDLGFTLDGPIGPKTASAR